MEGSQRLPVSDGGEDASLSSSSCSYSSSTSVDSIIIPPLSPNNSRSSNPLFTSLFDLNTVSRPKNGRSVTKFVKEVVVQRRPVFKGTHVAFEEETIEYAKEIEESIHKNNKDLKINLFKGCKPLDQFTGKLALMPLHRTSRELEIKHGGFNSEAKESYKKSVNEVLLSRGKDFRKEIHDILNISSEFRLRSRSKLPLSQSLSTADIGDAIDGEVKVAEHDGTIDIVTPDVNTDKTSDVTHSLLNRLGSSNITADVTGQTVQTAFPESTLSLGDYRYNSMNDGKSLANLSRSPLYWCRKYKSKSKPKPSSESSDVTPSKSIVESEDDKEVVLLKESRLISETYCQITIIGVNITGRLFNTNNSDSMEGDSETNNNNFYGAGSRISRYIRVEVYSFWSCQKHELVLTVNEVKSLVANITAVCTVSRRLGPPESVSNLANKSDEKAPGILKIDGRMQDDAEVNGDTINATTAVAVSVNGKTDSKKAKSKGKEIKVKSIVPISIATENENKEQSGFVDEVLNSNPNPSYSDNGHYRIFDEDERKLWFLLRPGNRTPLMSRIVDSLFFRYTIMCEKSQRLAAKAKFKKKNPNEETAAEEAPLIGSIGADGKKILSPTEIRRAEKKRLATIANDGKEDASFLSGPSDTTAKDSKNVSDTHPANRLHARKNKSKEMDPSAVPVVSGSNKELLLTPMLHESTALDADFYVVGEETNDKEDDGSVASHRSLQLNEYNEKVIVTVDHLEDPVLPEGYPKTVHGIMTLINNNCRFSDDQSGNPLTLYVPHLSESLTLGINKLESSRAKRARLFQALLEKRERENAIIRKKWKEVIPRKRGLVFSKVIRRLGRHLRVRIYNGGLDYLLQPPREDTKRVLVVDFVRDAHSVVLNVGYYTLFTYSGLTSELHFSQWSEETLLRTYRNMTKAIAIQLVQDDDENKNKSSSKPDPMGYLRAKEVREAKEIAANKDGNEGKTQAMTIRVGKLCSAQFDSYPLDGLTKIRKFKGHLATCSSANSSLKISEKEKNDLVTTLDTRDWFYINFGGNVNLRRYFTIDTEFSHHRDSIVTHAYQMYPPDALTPPMSDMFCLETKQKGVKQNPQKHLKFPSSSSLDICNGNARLLRVLKRLGGVVCIVTVYLISKPIPIKTSQEVPIFNAYDFLKKPAEVTAASVTNPDFNSATATADTVNTVAAINPDIDPNYVDPYAEPPFNEPSEAAAISVPEQPKKAANNDDDVSAMMFAAPPPGEEGGGDGNTTESTAEPDMTGPKQSFYDTFAQETIFRIAIHRTDNCFSSIKENDYFSKYDYYFDLTRDSFFSFFLSDEGLLYGAYQCSYEKFFEDLGARVTSEVPEKNMLDDDKEEDATQKSDGASVETRDDSDSMKLKNKKNEKKMMKKKKKNKKNGRNNEKEDGNAPKSNVIARPVIPYPHCVLSWDDCRSLWERVLTQLFSSQLFNWTLGLAPSSGKLPKSREKKVYNPDDDNDDDYFAAAVVEEEIRVFTPLTVSELIKCCYYTGTDGLNGRPDRAPPPPPSVPLSLKTMKVSEDSEDTASTSDDLVISAPVAPVTPYAIEPADSAAPVVASTPPSQTSTAAAQDEIMILLPALSTIVMRGNFRMRFSDHIYTRYGKAPSEPLPPKVEVVKMDEDADNLSEDDDLEDDDEVAGEGGGVEGGKSNTKKGDDGASREVLEPNLDECETEEDMIAMVAEMEKQVMAKAAELEKKRLEKMAANQAVAKKDKYKKQRKNTRAMLVYVWQLENEMGLVVYDPVSNANHTNITNAILCFRPPLVVQAMHISMTRFMTPIDRYNYYKLYCMHELRICKVHNDGVFTNDREVVATNGSD